MGSRWLGCLLVLAVACGDSAGGNGSGFPTGNAAGSPGGTGGLANGGGQAVTPGSPGGTTGTGTAGTGTAGTGTTGTGATGGTAGESSAANNIPCDVAKILQDKCQTCHGDPVVGAPMSIVTWADLQADSGEMPGKKVYERIHERINDASNPMPPAARPALTDDEKATLDAYVNGGAQPSATACASDGTTGTGGDTGGTSTTAACDPNDENGGFGCYNVPDSECEVLQELRAHGGQTADDTTPFEAPTGGDHYEIFWFTPQWTEKMHVIRLDPIVDNGAVLHHWLLYMRENADNPDGSHEADSGLQSSDSQLLSGWAPGNESIPTGTKTGLQSVQGPNGRFGIEIHFNTSANPPNRKDRSGVRVCATSKLREREAAVSWLGTQAIVGIGKFDAVGTCTPTNEAHIIATSPHMHLTGAYMKSIVNKKDGSTATIVDKPFSFDDQAIYPIKSPTREVLIQPGDTITTTCSFDSPGFITFGPGTSDEMCYNFVVAWPAGALSNGSPGLVGGANTCIDGI